MSEQCPVRAPNLLSDDLDEFAAKRGQGRANVTEGPGRYEGGGGGVGGVGGGVLTVSPADITWTMQDGESRCRRWGLGISR